MSKGIPCFEAKATASILAPLKKNYRCGNAPKLATVSRQRIRILILTGLISIGGTLLLQLTWLQQAADLSEREFSDRVVTAMTEVVGNIQSMRGDSAVVEPVRQASSNYFVANLNDTLHPFLLEALLRESFQRAALSTDFEYAIYDCFSDSILYGGRVGQAPTDNGPSPRFDRDGHYFGIRFPERRSDLIMSLDRWLIASLLQLLVLCTFVYTVVIVLRQKRLSEVRDDFINNMTHEFKTPIASIESGAQLLQREDVGSDPKARGRYLDLILSENRRMRRQVEKVMEIATLDGQAQGLQKEAFSVVSWIEAGTAAFHPSIELNGGQTQLQINTSSWPEAWGPDPVMMGDRTHLDGVLSNLLDNAVRYAGDTPPHITVTLDYVTGNQPMWLVKIVDCGMGIPKEHQSKIFERFHRVPTGNRHDVKGFGLGLHYVNTIVRAHGGKVSCASEVGAGSTFSVQLPAHQA